VGLVEITKTKIREQLDSWKVFAERTGKDPKKPTGKHAEAINREKGMLLLLEAEARECNRILDEAEKKEREAREAVQANRAKRYQLRGFCRRKDGVVYEVDNQPVVDGKLPDGTPLEDYLEKVKADKIAEAKKQFALEKERNENVRHFPQL
jgi:hypothetical protein